MIRVVGDRVLVALPPRVDETVSAGGIVLVKDPDRFYTPTRGIVVALGEKSGMVDLDEVLAIVDTHREECVRHECGRLDGECCVGTCESMAEDVKALAPAQFDVQIGDCVLFPQSAGEEIRDGEIEYVILREADILGVLEPLQKASAA